MFRRCLRRGPPGSPTAGKEKAIALSRGPQRRREVQTRINRMITSRSVRVISADNEQLGILSIEDAINQAEEQGLDLVEVSPTADPPVCRIMDYGQFKYQQSKRQHEAKKHQKVTHLKEVKFRPRTDEHDFNFKLRHATEFIEAGDKVKVTVMFRGRELSHRELGKVLLDRVVTQMEPIAQVESMAKMEGRTMTLVLAPIKKS